MVQIAAALQPQCLPVVGWGLAHTCTLAAVVKDIMSPPHSGPTVSHSLVAGTHQPATSSLVTVFAVLCLAPFHLLLRFVRLYKLIAFYAGTIAWLIQHPWLEIFSFSHQRQIYVNQP